MKLIRTVTSRDYPSRNKCMKCLTWKDEEGHCDCCPRCGEATLDNQLRCRGECVAEDVDRAYDAVRDERDQW